MGTRLVGWSLTEHACRTCGGRILQKRLEYMCADCERTALHKVEALCGCGMRAPKDHLSDRNHLLQAYRCAINSQSWAIPQKICIFFGSSPAVPEHD